MFIAWATSPFFLVIFHPPRGYAHRATPPLAVAGNRSPCPSSTAPGGAKQGEGDLVPGYWKEDDGSQNLGISSQGHLTNNTIQP